MKSFSYLIVLSLAVNLLGCKNQNQVKQNERLTTVSESEELVFGDKKLTYFIEGQGIPCIVCADGNIQAYCLSENLKKNFQIVFTEPRHGTYYDEPKDYSYISMDTIVDDIEIAGIARQKIPQPLDPHGHNNTVVLKGRRNHQLVAGDIPLDLLNHRIYAGP